MQVQSSLSFPEQEDSNDPSIPSDILFLSPSSPSPSISSLDEMEKGKLLKNENITNQESNMNIERNSSHIDSRINNLPFDSIKSTSIIPIESNDNDVNGNSSNDNHSIKNIDNNRNNVNDNYSSIKLIILISCLFTLLTIAFIYFISFYIHFTVQGPIIKIVNFTIEPVETKMNSFNNHLNSSSNPSYSSPSFQSTFDQGKKFKVNMEIMTRAPFSIFSNSKGNDRDGNGDKIMELEYLFVDIIQNDIKYIKMENISRNSILTRGEEKRWFLSNLEFNVDKLEGIKLVARLKYSWYGKWWKIIYIPRPYRQDVRIVV